MLVLDYLKKARRATPEVEMKARELINICYQRLLAFEVKSGGFEWMGRDPANLILSAYGLMEFVDMAKVYDIDERIIDRTRNYILSQQQKDGSFKLGQTGTGWTWSNLQAQLTVTSYVTWSLCEAGIKGKEVDAAIKYIKDHLDDAKDDPYTMSLIANALVLYHPKDKDLEKILETLVNSKEVDNERNVVFWKSPNKTLYYGGGNAGAVEATSLVALSMIRSGLHPETCNKALSYLVKSRDGSGAWGSTQATILALKTLVVAMSGKEQKGDVTVKVKCNDAERVLKITPDQADVMQLVDFKDVTKTGANTLDVEVTGEGNLMYQVVARHYLPWSEVREEERAEPITFKIDYDRTQLKKDDMLTCNVSMKYNLQVGTFMVIADLGIPAGFDVVPDAFEKMLGEKRISKYTLTGRQITLYFDEIKPNEEVKFSYQLKPKYPIKVKTPESTCYEYYNPDNKARTKPVELEVTEK